MEQAALKQPETDISFLSDAEIEQKVISDFFSEFEALPVKFAKSLGLKVFYEKESFWGILSGRLKNGEEKNKYEIRINRHEPIERQRFTVAHEIAHFIRHKEKLISNGGTLLRHGNDKVEKEADELAAKILMPKDKVEEFIEKTRLHSSQKDVLVEKMANAFKVSKIAAVIRLRNLGYYVPYLEFS